MAGRRVFYGWPYYAWSAGYDASKRDKVYVDLFENRDPEKVYRLLRRISGIKYVGFDGAVRHADFIKRPNEQLYATYFPKVFEDSRYNGLIIYKVPDKPPPKLSSVPEGVSNMFDGGRGSDRGQFDAPTGIAVDAKGNVLVADTGNGRIEKFSPTGIFLAAMGIKGTAYGQLGAPNGIAVDRTGNIYVADASKHVVEKLAPDGTITAEWKGPDAGFYGTAPDRHWPRRFHLCRRSGPHANRKAQRGWPGGWRFGVQKARDDGQFDDHTSVAVDPRNNRVYVADPINRRIQVFDSNGKFLTKWIVPEWGRPHGFEDLAIDPKTGRLYAFSANMDAVLIFDLNGTRIGTLTPKPSERLYGLSALALANGKTVADET